MAAYEKSKGRSLYEKMLDLYVKFGYYQEDLISITKKGRNGQQEIAEMMESFRANPPKELAGGRVVELLDYDKQVKTNLQTGGTETITLPKSNVLQFITEDGSKISARPSGTEPKIKFYFSVNTGLASPGQFDEAQQKAKDKIKQIIAEMKLEG
jgi:phosphoglucomutase